MFDQLAKINARPKPFEFYSAGELWTDTHTSSQMLAFHLNPEIDISSRNAAFISQSTQWIATHFGIGPGTAIADFGCGPGLYTTGLARYQADLTGIDFSSRSIEHAMKTAKKENLSIHYENINYLSYETDKRFHLILMIFCDFCALSPDQRKKLLAKFHQILEPEGVVLLDVFSLKMFDQLEETYSYELNLLDGFWSASKYYGFFNKFKYEAEKIALDKYTIIEPGRSRTIYNWLQYFSPESLNAELSANGFKIDAAYADVAGAPFDPEKEEFAVVARKQ